MWLSCSPSPWWDYETHHYILFFIFSMEFPIASAPSCPHGKLWDPVATPQCAKAQHSEGWPMAHWDWSLCVLGWINFLLWTQVSIFLNRRVWLKRNCQKFFMGSIETDWDRKGGVQLGKTFPIPPFPHSTCTLVRIIFWYPIDTSSKKRLLQLTENLKLVHSHGLSSLGASASHCPFAQGEENNSERTF